MTDVSDTRWISGFWQRIGALVIDMLFLGVSGYGAGLFFEEQFVALGDWGRLFGFFVALLYFGIFNSKLCRGQTIGKILLDIRVVDGKNQTIGLLRSFARYSILGVPFFLNDASFTRSPETTFWTYLLSLITFGGLLSATYLYVFNRATRQSLHDLATGTYVVNEACERRPIEAFWQPHFRVVLLLLLGAALFPAVLSMALGGMDLGATALDEGQAEEVQTSRAALLSHPLVDDVFISAVTHTIASPSSEAGAVTYLVAQANVEKDKVPDAELAEQLAQILADSYPNAQKFDFIDVVLTYGYDIGIASSGISQSHQFYPVVSTTDD